LTRRGKKWKQGAAAAGRQRARQKWQAKGYENLYTSSGTATFAPKGSLFKEFCFRLRLAFIDASKKCRVQVQSIEIWSGIVF